MSNPAASDAPRQVAEHLVAAQRTLAGPHPGFRPVHAKGIVCAGDFHPALEANRVSRAAHFRAPVPATIRFSNGSGDPAAHDGQPANRAMSVKFHLPGGRHTDLLANSTDGFPAGTPEEFLDFLRASLPDPATGKPDPVALPRFLESHPAAKAFIARLMQKPIPAGYDRASYHAVHAFRFTASDGVGRVGRYHWLPLDGEAVLTPEEGARREPNFLLAELNDRLSRGPAPTGSHGRSATAGRHP